MLFQKVKRKSVAVCQAASPTFEKDEATSQDEVGGGVESEECVEDPVGCDDTREEEREAADCAETAGEGIEDEKSKKSHHIQGLYKPPTHDELQTLKETQNLFKSNLMKLQVTLL